MTIKTKEQLKESLSNVLRKISDDCDYDKDHWLNTIKIKFTNGNTHSKGNQLFIWLNYERYSLEANNEVFCEYTTVVEKCKIEHYRAFDGTRYILTKNPDEWLFIHELAHILSMNTALYENEKIKPHGYEFCETYKYLRNIVRPSVRYPF